ncbi:major facilitator superfamily domain-containing protein [Cadophora sp. MPI-SDFR-AT-0126]|nr:major facilitator superfamily domain-containing protein [Leotiomycetes sp. MPI-SDFR-AT-0126]
MEAQNAIILNDLDPGSNGIAEEETIHHEFSLPRADSGKDAWLFLAAGFVIEALVWGFPFSFGVFQEYYGNHELFSSDSAGIAVIGTTATGLMYMSGLVLFPAYKRFPHLASTLKWAGLPFMAAGLFAASFAQKVQHLIVTQGVIYAIGGCIIYYPTLLYIDEWFVQRKGLAFGIMWAGTGAGGLIIPFVLNGLLQRWGFRTTLRIWATALLILSSPLIYFLRPRIPVSRNPTSQRYVGLGFLKSPSFWLLQIGLVIESLGYFIPSLYLPTFASSLGLSRSVGTVLVALLNAAGVVATVLMGMLCDRFHVTTVIVLCSVGATFSVFLFWGLSTALPLLIVFAIVYGFFASGFVSTNAGVMKMIKGEDPTVDMGLLIGIISAARGVGAVASGPLSEALLRGEMWKGKVGLGYGSGYGGLIVFTGVTAGFGGIGFLGKRLGWM